jgi:5-dehydro-2-deoxygluconokinase
MMNCSRVFMLASDHRWQWEEWCDGHGTSRSRIGEVKRLVLDAFVQARAKSPEVRQFGSLLLDNTYGAEAVRHARAQGIPVGTPVEKAGVFPLQWEREPFHALAEGNSFCKVLIRYRPDWTAEARNGQFEKLLQLQTWCRHAAIPLLVEIIIMREGEDEQSFEHEGRPVMLSGVIREAYARGLVPALWKIEGTASREGAAMIDAAIREQPVPRQVILGKGADARAIGTWFDAAAGLTSMAGFAIGRSVFMEPGAAYLRGALPAAEAAEQIADRYLGFVREWTRREQPTA